MIEPKGRSMLIDCYECKAKVSDHAAQCPHCGAVNEETAESLPVEVVDFNMRFGTMFWFLIKLSFAAVPAVVVIYTAWTIISGVMSPLLHM